MGQSPFNPNPRKYNKSNFVDIVELITPAVYQTEDIALSGTELNPLSNIINSNIRTAANFSQVIPLSAVTASQTSNLDNISGISQYFVKQNNLTNITPYLFETKILLPLSTTLANYDTSSEFNNYLSGTLLPMIIPAADASNQLNVNITTLSAMTGNAEPSSVHNYLVDNLGWMYFLNTSANGGLNYSPSSYVLSSLNSLYLGNTIETVDGIKGLTEYLWRNYATCSVFSQHAMITQDFVSGVSDGNLETSSGLIPVYTSGIQKLDALKTLIDVIYSPLYIDQEDYTVETAFQNYIDASLYLDDHKSKGPYRKFSNLLGFNFADISDEVENIGLIYDIENVRDEHLQYIADLIGWKLRGSSASKWRHQLRNAVSIYKRSGTLSGIQAAIDTLVVESVFDVSGKVQELWESYLPQLIWYALGTESKLFRDLNTWTYDLAQDAGVIAYSTSSLEENIKMVVDDILLDLYKAFPKGFLFHGSPWPVPRLYTLDYRGCIDELYTIVGDTQMKPFHVHYPTDDGYQALKQDADLFLEQSEWEAATCFGPLGSGVYMAGESHPTTGERPTYLSATGDLNFLFNYRGKENFPIPPFEEVKYFRDSSLTPELVELLVEKLKCFNVKPSFADNVGNYILSSAISTDTSLGTLNEFLMFFSSVQVPPNFDSVMLSISDYDRNLLPLWNGKSSHLFLDYEETDFDFAKTTMEGDSQYALFEASRVAREFAPAHAIVKTNLNASASDGWDGSSTKWEYLGLDKDDTRAFYTSASLLGNFEVSGTAMSFADGGGDGNQGSNDGRGGLNTFKRPKADQIIDTLLSSTTSITTAPRRALRRRNFRYTLPLKGYYDRTGFNAPVNWQASSQEYSMPSSLGEFTLGYVASAGKFYPIVDPVTPSGVWHWCEKLDSSRSFSGVATSATFPYRGLSSLGSNLKMPEVASGNAFYIDRCQTPPIYITMHELFESQAKDYAFQQISKYDNSLSHEDTNSWATDYQLSAYAMNAYWKDNVQSFANEAIASGFVLKSFEDYRNFKFGIGLQKAYKDYCKYFNKHPLGSNYIDYTGGNIFAQVFGLGLFNCDFTVDGSAVGGYVASSVGTASAINAGTLWNYKAVTENKGTYVASSVSQGVIPLSGSWVAGNINNAEYRNPHILSGIEFTDISGATSKNQFEIFKVAKSHEVKGGNNYLIDNALIKCKSVGGLPRLRFDLSAYGSLRNYFIKDHKFKLNIKGLVGDEHNPFFGGGNIGVWIHTQPQNGFMWVWTPQQKWIPFEEKRLSIDSVLSMSHQKSYTIKEYPEEKDFCLANQIITDSVTNPARLKDVKSEYLEDFEVNFDTRNYTIHNNSEYLKIIPIEEKYYKHKDQVNTDDTNYIIEIFFVPNNDKNKYLLIDNISLQDITQRENTAIGTGHGIQTSGIPLRKFVKEDKLYLKKDQLMDIFKFYNGLIGQGTGVYATNLASRDATITSGTMEVSGGGRLNYRIQPNWTNLVTTQANFNDYTNVEIDN